MNIPFHGVLVASNESLKIFLRGDDHHNSTQSFMLSGFISGAIASFCTNPLDVAKTRLQTQALNLYCSGFHKPGESTPSAAWKPIGLRGSPSLSQQEVTPFRGISSKTQNIAGSIRYKGMLDALRGIFVDEGIRGLMRGAGPRLLVHAPAAAISWTSYEAAKSFLLTL